MKKIILNLVFIFGVVIVLKNGESIRFPKSNNFYVRVGMGKMVSVQIYRPTEEHEKANKHDTRRTAAIFNGEEVRYVYYD